jgi:uncharacterized membrane protein YjgN (DUF898 family)
VSQPSELRLVPKAVPTAPPPVAPADGAVGESRQLAFHGSGGSLFGIQIVNIFRTLLTFGIYHFWGKVRVRSYLLSQTEFEGDRFAYHGTGKELLIGWLKAVLAFGGLYALFNALPFLPGGTAVRITAFAGAYLLLLAFLAIALVGSRRYRLSRISWRGIRFSFRGPLRDFITLFVGGSLLTLVTVGLYYPFFAVKQHAFMLSHSYLGNQRFEFDGRGRDLFGSYLLAVLVTLPTMGLGWLWFLAKKQRYLWDHTSCGSARFHCTVTGGRLLRLYAGNVLLLIVTLGLGWAWVVLRNIRVTFAYLTLDGPLDLSAIQQDVQTATATGEGLSSFLDVGTDFAVG